MLSIFWPASRLTCSILMSSKALKLSRPLGAYGPVVSGYPLFRTCSASGWNLLATGCGTRRPQLHQAAASYAAAFRLVFVALNPGDEEVVPNRSVCLPD